MSAEEFESFVSENVAETIWLRLRRLTSTQLTEQLLRSRETSVDDALIKKKSVGMSSAIRSALGYWDTKEGGLNSKLVSRYYALLQITIAIQIASLDNTDDLASVQRHTENGHGLFTLPKPNGSFPDEYFVGCLKSGHFASFVKSMGADLSPQAHESRPRAIEKAKPDRLISLGDLLRRVPEFQQVITEYIGQEPLSVRIHQDAKTMDERQKRYPAQFGGSNAVKEPEEPAQDTTYLAFYPGGTAITKRVVESLGLDLTNIESASTAPPWQPMDYLIGKYMHASGSKWFDLIPTYKSGYCGTSVIVPFWGMRDPLTLHLAILYAFSIVARYLPDRWYEMRPWIKPLSNCRQMHWGALLFKTFATA
jgi:hypothetical protein